MCNLVGVREEVGTVDENCSCSLLFFIRHFGVVLLCCGEVHTVLYNGRPTMGYVQVYKCEN